MLNIYPSKVRRYEIVYVFSGFFEATHPTARVDVFSGFFEGDTRYG